MNENMGLRLIWNWGGQFGGAIYGLIMLSLVGCSSMPSLHMPSINLTAAPLKLDLAANPTADQTVHSKRPVVLSIAKYADARATPNSQKIGDITAAVNDMLGTELHLQDLAGTVTSAVENQLRASGFQVFADAGEPSAKAGFVISGAIKEFNMTIGGRDEIAIAVETTLRDTRSGSVLWSGVVKEKADRFAGVTGNSRNSITRYINAALAKVSGKTRDALSEGMLQARPDLFTQSAPARQSTPGVTVLVAPSEPAQVVKTHNTGIETGRLSLTSIPSRAKVYVADVYYGLTPLNLDLEPAIYTLRFKLDGFQSAAEKVSARKGETTELEMKLDK